MAKVKYFFNPNNLKYERYTPSLWRKILRFSGFLSSSFFFGLIFLGAFHYLVDSPKEKQLKREIAFYEHQMKLMDQRVGQLAGVLGDLEQRDEKVYRVIFEAEPIPSSVRKAGFGGVEKYRKLGGYSLSDLLKQVNLNLDKLGKQMYIQSKSYDEIAELAMKKTEMLACIPAIQPLKNDDLTRVASGYGYRVHPVYKAVKFHDGLDFSAPTGTEVFATGNGVIETAEYDRRGYGNHVVVDHGYGYKTKYAHLSELNVKRGQKVKRGELLGLIGSTGLSTAPHLHYEVIKNNKKINPINFFYNDLTPAEYEKVLELANQANQSFD